MVSVGQHSIISKKGIAIMKNRLEEKIEIQRRVIELQQKIINTLCQQQALVGYLAFPNAQLTPENVELLKKCEEQVPDLKMGITRLGSLLDQLNAARDELQSLG